MTTPVPGEHIERIVGVKRHPTDHWGRAVSAEERFFILHSAECFTATNDLRTCPYSLALDRGIEPTEWPMDQPVTLRIEHGRLATPPTQEDDRD